jgi:hypothetical protein
VHFGSDRVTMCAQCEFTCTGDTDDAMARAWNAHSNAMRRTTPRSGPVERIDADDVDAEDDFDGLADTA